MVSGGSALQGALPGADPPSVLILSLDTTFLKTLWSRTSASGLLRKDLVWLLQNAKANPKVRRVNAASQGERGGSLVGRKSMGALDLVHVKLQQQSCSELLFCC